MHQGSFTEKSALGKIRQIVCVVPQHPYNNPTGAKSVDTAPYVYRSMVLTCDIILFLLAAHTLVYKHELKIKSYQSRFTF